MAHNIEKSAFRRGEYVGYANGAWRIARTGNRWIATYSNGCGIFTRRTLREIGAELERRNCTLPWKEGVFYLPSIRGLESAQ